MNDLMSKRIEEIKVIFEQHKTKIIYFILGIIVYVSSFLRTYGIESLKDITTGKYILRGFDSFIFYRYFIYYLENGALMVNDVMRYVPLGYDPRMEFSFLSSILAYSYKLLSLFFANLTPDLWIVIYPVVFFGLFLVVFFLLVKEIFDYKVALLSTAILSIVPDTLIITIAGVFDKESFAIVMMVLAFLFYIKSWTSETNKKAVLMGALSGFSTALVGYVWGGVQFIFLIFGVVSFLGILFDKYNDKSKYSHILWFVTAFVMMIFVRETRFSFQQLIFSTITILPLFTTISFSLDLFRKKFKIGIIERINEKLPKIIAYSLIFLTFIIIFGVISGPEKMIERATILINDITYYTAPVDVLGRFGNSIVESQPPEFRYLRNYVGNIIMFLGALGGLIILNSFVKKKKEYFIGGYLIFIFSILFGRLKDSMFSDISLIKILPVLILLVFLVYLFYNYLRDFYKKENNLEEKFNFENKNLFLMVYFIIILLASTAMLRLVILLDFILVIFTAYVWFYLFDKSKNIEKKKIKVISIFLLFWILISPLGGVVKAIPLVREIPFISEDGIFPNYYIVIKENVKNHYLYFNHDWQRAMGWVRENTSSDAVFASWWDYGYFIQAIGERATISDGGNNRGRINYLTSRYLITNTNDTEVLEFLYANKVNYILFEPSDIGKYAAISLIGSDINEDRYSIMLPLTLKNQQKMPNEMVKMMFRGQQPIDEDVNINGNNLKRRVSSIVGVEVNIKGSIKNLESLEQPKVFISDKGKLIEAKIKCLVMEDKKLIFDNFDLDGCFMMVPNFVNNKLNLGGVYMSNKIINGFFGKHYLLGMESEYFEKVYDYYDMNARFKFVNGGFLGPITIFKINYPEDIKDNSFYRSTSGPEA